MRGGATDVAWPKFPAFTFPCTKLNWAWLKTLKNSARNCKFSLSVRRVSFNKAMSQLLTPGPWKKRRCEFPSCPTVSSVKPDVLKYSKLGAVGEVGRLRGLRMRTGPPA